MEKSKSEGRGGGGGGGRVWLLWVLWVEAVGMGGGRGMVPPASMALNLSGSMLAMSFEKEGGGGRPVMLASFLGPLRRCEGSLVLLLVPSMFRPGMPGRMGCFAGIFWSMRPSASSSSSCSSSSRIDRRPPRRSQVPWASARASPRWYRSLKQSVSPGLARAQNLVTRSLDPEARMWPSGCQSSDQTLKSCAYWILWAGYIVCAGALLGSTLS